MTSRTSTKRAGSGFTAEDVRAHLRSHPEDLADAGLGYYTNFVGPGPYTEEELDNILSTMDGIEGFWAGVGARIREGDEFFLVSDAVGDPIIGMTRRECAEWLIDRGILEDEEFLRRVASGKTAACKRVLESMSRMKSKSRKPATRKASARRKTASKTPYRTRYRDDLQKRKDQHGNEEGQRMSNSGYSEAQLSHKAEWIEEFFGNDDNLEGFLEWMGERGGVATLMGFMQYNDDPGVVIAEYWIREYLVDVGMSHVSSRSRKGASAGTRTTAKRTAPAKKTTTRRTTTTGKAPARRKTAGARR